MSDIELLCKVFPDEREALCALYESAGSLAALFGMNTAGLVSLGADSSLAEKITAAAELSRQYFISLGEEKSSLLSSDDAREYLMPRFMGLSEEKLVTVYLNGRAEVIKAVETTGGTSDEIRFDATKTVQEAIRSGAKGVILAHNHPNGFAVPSKQDIEMTKDLALLMKDIGVTLCEHIIFAGSDHCLLSSHCGADYLAYRS